MLVLRVVDGVGLGARLCVGSVLIDRLRKSCMLIMMILMMRSGAAGVDWFAPKDLEHVVVDCCSRNLGSDFGFVCYPFRCKSKKARVFQRT